MLYSFDSDIYTIQTLSTIQLAMDHINRENVILPGRPLELFSTFACYDDESLAVIGAVELSQDGVLGKLLLACQYL